jgi:hypothetical protein
VWLRPSLPFQLGLIQNSIVPTVPSMLPDRA